MLQSWIWSYVWETGEEERSPSDMCQAGTWHMLEVPPVFRAFARVHAQPNGQGQPPPAQLQQMERRGRLPVGGAGQRSCALQLRLMKLIWWADYSCVLVRRWHGAPRCTRHRRKGTTQAPYCAFHLGWWTRWSRRTGFWMLRRIWNPSL